MPVLYFDTDNVFSSRPYLVKISVALRFPNITFLNIGCISSDSHKSFSINSTSIASFATLRVHSRSIEIKTKVSRLRCGQSEGELSVSRLIIIDSTGRMNVRIVLEGY
jgi:hypothetical protein